MTQTNIIEEKPVPMAELKKELKKIKKRDEELNFRAEKTEEYLQQFNILNDKETKALYKKIEKLEIPRLKPEHIVKLVDILPTSADEVKTILQGYTITVSKDNLKKIADVIPEQ
ncbi:hypothetical protein ACFL0V_02710 [Nanoarchaeota archaeon]